MHAAVDGAGKSGISYQETLRGFPLPAPDKATEHLSRRFPTTSWSLIATAGRDSSGAADALSALCTAYWMPVYALIRRKRYSPEESEDLSQGFFARVLEHGTLLEARQERGRFRSFLLASVTHFPANEWDRAHQGRALRRPVRNHGPELPMAEPGYREPAARGAIQR